MKDIEKIRYFNPNVFVDKNGYVEQTHRIGDSTLRGAFGVLAILFAVASVIYGAGLCLMLGGVSDIFEFLIPFCIGLPFLLGGAFGLQYLAGTNSKRLTQAEVDKYIRDYNLAKQITNS